MTVHLDTLLKKSADEKKTMCVFMLDIDHFKAVNDTYGHGVGDEVLQTFAERISNNLRSFDLVVRMGGEEFLVVMPDTNLDTAKKVSERLRKSVCGSPFRVSAPVGHIDVSVSIGGVMIENGSATVDEAVQRADVELYKAKEGGRNRVYIEGQGLVTLAEPAPGTESAAKTIAETI
jgi:two-component system cell cycle response regulator